MRGGGWEFKVHKRDLSFFLKEFFLPRGHVSIPPPPPPPSSYVPAPFQRKMFLYALILIFSVCHFSGFNCFIPSPETVFGREELFYSCESVFLLVFLSVCKSVCLWFRDQDNQSSRPISIKSGRTLGYYKTKVKLEFEQNRIVWSQMVS